MAGRLTRIIASGVLLDVVTVVVVLLLSAGSALTADDVPTWVGLAAAGVGGLSLAWRQPYPEPVLLVCLLCYALSGIPFPAMLALGTVAAARGPVRGTWAWAAWTAAVVLAISAAPGETVSTSLEALDPVATLADVALVVAFPLALGLYVESRAHLLRQAQARAAALEASTELRTEQARGEERALIAREMHDVVAHRVSLIALHAGALEMTCEGRPEAETATLIRTTARRALEELREVVGVLRDPTDTAGRVPTPGLADVPALVHDWQSAGAPVALNDGVAELVEGTRSATAGRAVYRVVQEALTNASKHAKGAPVRVVVTAADDHLDVVVRNGPPTQESSRAGTGGGCGLIGLCERVNLAGGTFEAGPAPDGGFAVHAIVPVGDDREEPAAPAGPAESGTRPRRARGFPTARERPSRGLR